MATHAGFGGGLGHYNRLGTGKGTWVDNGQPGGNPTGANDRGNVRSLNSSPPNGGFMLEVNCSIGDLGASANNRAIIGLVATPLPPGTDSSYFTRLEIVGP